MLPTGRPFWLALAALGLLLALGGAWFFGGDRVAAFPNPGSQRQRFSLRTVTSCASR